MRHTPRSKGPTHTVPTNQNISRPVFEPPVTHAQTFLRIKSGLVALGSIFLLIQPIEAVEIHQITGPEQTLQGQALSGDGKVVVGSQGNAPSSRPFRWSLAGGYQAMAAPSYASHGWVSRANFDGSAFIGNFLGGTPGYRWTESGSYTAPITAPLRRSAAALGISGDGTVVVGDSRWSGTGFYAFRFIAGGYTVIDDVNDDGKVLYKEFFDVSADGRYVVGKGQFEINVKIFRHDFDTGARIVLGTSDDFWTAAAISADATVVTGQTSNIAISPFRWDIATGDVTFLGSLDPTRPARQFLKVSMATARSSSVVPSPRPAARPSCGIP